MSRHSRSVCLSLVLLVSWALVAPVAAQAPRKRSLRSKGEIKAVQPPFLQFNNTSGKLWTIKVEAKPGDVIYKGTADPSWLRRGMLVRFSAQLDQKANAQEPISELFVFVPRPGYGVGVSPELDGSFLVAGKLSSIKDGTLKLMAGRKTVTAELAEDATIQVELADYSLARPGDKIEMKGYFYQQGKGIASQLMITAAKPLATGEKKKKSTQQLRPAGQPVQGDRSRGSRIRPAQGHPDSSEEAGS